jgi:SAM-dependent methyltransferase
MQQTPLYDICNFDLLSYIPPSASRLVDVGCMSGATAREYKKINPACHYFGIDIDPQYAQLAAVRCDQVASFDIEDKPEEFYRENSDTDCWIMGDVLEHLRDPWLCLSRIRKHLKPDGCIVACIPNAQNWSIIAKLAIGDFRYEDRGLLDKTHIRWFTRQTIIELFQGSGFRIEQMKSRSFEDPSKENPILPLIGEIARRCGAAAETSITDARVFQYILRAVPA